MAEPLTERAALETPKPPAAAEQPGLLRRTYEASLPRRFALAYLLLAAALGAGVGLAVVFLSRSDSNGATVAQSRWSEWRPSASGTLAVREIAREIAPRYRLPNGQQLVGVIAGPMQLRTSNGPIPVSVLAIASGQAGVPEQRVEIEFPSAGVFFQLCGSGAGCLIPGSASAERGLLVRREALELALYTFHYLPEADHVLTFLPPPPGVQPSDPEFRRVVYLPRVRLAPLLRVPLSSALPPGTTTLKPGDLAPQQGRVVDTFTAPQIFHYDFQQLPDQSALVQLSPIEP